MPFRLPSRGGFAYPEWPLGEVTDALHRYPWGVVARGRTSFDVELLVSV